MQKFIVRSIIFLLPFLLLYISVPFFYSDASDRGDIYRIGYYQKEDNYRPLFKNELHLPVNYTTISSIDTCFKSKYNVLVIGDSFSEWRTFNYQNIMARDSTISILFYDLEGNPVEILYALINGNFFEEVSIDYVILQSVERDFPVRADINPNSRMSLNDIRQTVKKIQTTKKQPHNFRKNIPLDNSIVKFFGINFLRIVKKDRLAAIYQFEATKPVFSSEHEKRILVFEMDIYHLPRNSDTTAIVKLNNVLNHLSELVSEKGSRLIVLPAPDKYNVYYDFIIGREKYPQPMFFNIMKSLDKQYIYINSDEILKNAVSSGIKDVYFADDTHWSPVGAKMIVETIKSKMKY